MWEKEIEVMPKLQDELKINGMRLRNRIAMPPLTTNYGSADGIVTEDVLQFYRERSEDVGLIIVEASAVRSDGTSHCSRTISRSPKSCVLSSYYSSKCLSCFSRQSISLTT